MECTIQEYSGGTLNWDSAEVASVRAVAEQAVRRELEQGFAALRTAGADVICALETMEKFQPDFCGGVRRRQFSGAWCCARKYR